MSWRQVLSATPAKATSYTQNTHNTQNPPASGNCAYIADCAYRDSNDEDSQLLEGLAAACKDLPITPGEVRDALAPEDIEDWREGQLSSDGLAAFARSLLQRRGMDRGIRPDHYTERATCRQCGPIWLWFAGEVLGCPWCLNQAADQPIPRPCPVHCDDCVHFQRTGRAQPGHCARGEPEALAGLWGSDARYCERFLPVTGDGQMKKARQAAHAEGAGLHRRTDIAAPLPGRLPADALAAQD